MNAETKCKPNILVWGKQHLAVLIVAISAVVVSLGIVIALSFPTSADPILPESRDVFTLNDSYNMTVVVVFDEERPIVQFVAPDGTLSDMANIRYRPGSNFTQYFLPGAMPGVWSMNYDPLSNTEISTPYSVYMNHIFIKGFNADMMRAENGLIPVSFEVSADDAGAFGYEIHAIFTAPDNSIISEILLLIGNGSLNEAIHTAVDTNEIQCPEGFMLRLTTYVQHGQASVQDTAWLDLRLTPISNVGVLSD